MVGVGLDVKAIEVTLEEWERRKRFASFTADDEVLLASLSTGVGAYVDDVVDQRYDQILSFEETAAFFPDQETIDRVKAL